MYLFTNEEARNADTEMQSKGFSSNVLMENAGTAFLEAAHREIGVLSHKNILVCCGPGNNGADGLVIARKMINTGATVTIMVPRSMLIPSSSVWYLQFHLLQLSADDNLQIQIIEDFEEVYLSAVHYDLIVDALFGVGLNRPLADHYLRLIYWINCSDIPIGSADLVTSGIICADFVVVFGLIKVDLIYGYTHFKHLYFTNLSASYHKIMSRVSVNQPVSLQPRDLAGHKGSFGQALFVGGAANYYGAPYFNAMSFLLCGGGYSRLAAPKSICATVAARGPEIVFVPLEESPEGAIAASAVNTITPFLSTQQILAIGGGVTLVNSAKEFLFAFLEQNITTPVIIDGDGLTLLSQSPSWLNQPRQYPLILTPHLGEMARLSNLPVAKIKADPIYISQKYAQEWNVILVLKDAKTIIASPDGKAWCNLSGNDGLATPGSGDVLVGMIAALSCQSLPLSDSVRTAAFLHGLAADIAVEEIGKDGLTATKLMDYIPSALKVFRKSPQDYWHYRITILP